MNELPSTDLIDQFNAAPFRQDGWQYALDRLARETSSGAAQMIGFSENDEPFFNCITELEPDRLENFLAAGGGLARLNPRLNAGLSVPILTTLTDEALITRSERNRHGFYNDILPHSGTAYFCGTTLIRDPGMMVGLALLRRSTEGEISEPQHRLFKSIAPHVRAAFRTHLLLRDHGVALLAGSLAALDLTVFICDRNGRVAAMTPSAESLVSGAGPLQLRSGVLSADDIQLQLISRIRAVAAGPISSGHPCGESLVLRDQTGRPLALDIVQIPALECQLSFQPRALVMVRDRPRTPGVARQLLKAAYGLTEAESAVALLLSGGLSTEAISEQRQVSNGTTRMQLKSLFAKTGTHSQVELLAQLRPLL